jgi:hypothetical protein
MELAKPPDLIRRLLQQNLPAGFVPILFWGGTAIFQIDAKH